jgi:hypothetical protein
MEMLCGGECGGGFDKVHVEEDLSKRTHED